MTDKLRNLKNNMNRTVLKDGEMSDSDKQRIYHKVIKYKKVKRSVNRMVPTFAISACLFLIIILGSNAYIGTFAPNQVGEHSVYPESENSLIKDSSLSSLEEDEIHQNRFVDDRYKRIYAYLKEWTLPEEGRLLAESNTSNVTYQNGYSFSKSTGYLSSISWGDRDPNTDERPEPTEEQYMGVVMGFVSGKAHDLEVDLFPPLFTEVYDKSGNLEKLVNEDGIKTVHDRSSRVVTQFKLGMRYSGELPELQNELADLTKKAENLVSATESRENVSLIKAEKLDRQYKELTRDVVELSEVIDKARQDH